MDKYSYIQFVATRKGKLSKTGKCRVWKRLAGFVWSKLNYILVEPNKFSATISSIENVQHQYVWIIFISGKWIMHENRDTESTSNLM